MNREEGRAVGAISSSSSNNDDEDPSKSSSSSIRNVPVPGAAPPPQMQQPAPPVRRRLQPSEKQLKQQNQHHSSGSSHHHHHHHHSSHHHPPRQRSFSSPNQTIMAGLYDLEETLGKGHFATVKAAKHVFTGERVAVKVIDKTKLDTVSQKALLKEVICMKLVQHPNVVKLYEVIDTSTKMYLVLELGQGDLYDLIQRQQGGLPEQIARVYFTQILTAVSYCHKLHVAHRDLKPENVVFFPLAKNPDDQHSSSVSPSSSSSGTSPTTSPPLGQVKLTDFGFSNKFCPGVNLDTSCGSLAYSAPEILLGDSYDAPAVDIWSLGVILYMLVCGRAPFQEANDSETLTMIMDVKYSIPDTLTRALKDLIRKMLVRDPSKRARLDEIEKHPWVRGSSQQQHDSHDNHGKSARTRVSTTTNTHNIVPLITTKRLTDVESESIFKEMLKGGLVSNYEEVKSSLRSNAYNHVTSTYYLMAERLLREKARECESSQESLPTSPHKSSNASPTPPPSSPPMIIRRKNSHQFEDVVLPSNIPKDDDNNHMHHHHHHHHIQQTAEPKPNASIAGLDLEITSARNAIHHHHNRQEEKKKSQSQKFVCLPVIEPELEDEEQQQHHHHNQCSSSSSHSQVRSARNSSPHHPHYYHHLRGVKGGEQQQSSGGGGPAVSSPESQQEDSNASSSATRAQSPPLHYTRAKLNKSHHHSQSDSSDEGGCGTAGGGGGVGASVPPSISIVVSSEERSGGGGASDNDDDDDDDEEVVVVEEVTTTTTTTTRTQKQQRSNTTTNNNCLSVSNVMKPSPSYDNSVSGSSSSDSSSSGTKKKRVLFLSWFFKRSSGGKTSSNKKGERGNGGGSSTSGANGIYKTRSCAELKSRGCSQDGELSVRECFAVCNGDAPDNNKESGKRVNKR